MQAITNTQKIGLILKKFFPAKQTFCILAAHGKTTIALKRRQMCERLWPGMVIGYKQESNNNKTIFVHDVQIVMSPQPLSNTDITWVHHLLELCYYYIPHNNPTGITCEEIITYLTLLSHEHTHKTRMFLQQLCIAHFLHETGQNHIQKDLVSEQHLLQFFAALKTNNLTSSLINAIQQSTDLSHINNWIVKSLHSHPCFGLFKTIRFMYPSLNHGAHNER